MYNLTYAPPSWDVVVKPRSRARRSWLAGGAVAAVVVAALALVYLWQYAVILELNYDAARAKRELDKASQERALLRADLFRRRSMAEVDAVAHHELDMVAPAAGQIIILEEAR
jgi:hypothetical protein